MANHSTHVRKHIEKHGYDTVEQFMDVCLSIEHLIDPHSMFSQARGLWMKCGRKRRASGRPAESFKAKDYMDRWMNPPEEAGGRGEEAPGRQGEDAPTRTPSRPNARCAALPAAAWPGWKTGRWIAWASFAKKVITLRRRR